MADIIKYLKPADFLTVGGMVSGFTAILLYSWGELILGSFALLIAAFIDAIDGKVARKFGGATAFGKALDFSDIVSFGTAPAVLLCVLFPDSMGYVTASLFLTASLLRLARFNVMKKPSGGMPTTANGAIFPALCFLQLGLGFSDYFFVAAALVSCVLMLSSFKLRK